MEKGPRSAQEAHHGENLDRAHVPFVRQPVELPPGDSRFPSQVRKRHICCDNCKEWFSQKFGFDGRYVHHIEVPDSLAMESERVKHCEE